MGTQAFNLMAGGHGGGSLLTAGVSLSLSLSRLDVYRALREDRGKLKERLEGCASESIRSLVRPQSFDEGFKALVAASSSPSSSAPSSSSSSSSSSSPPGTPGITENATDGRVSKKAFVRAFNGSMNGSSNHPSTDLSGTTDAASSSGRKNLKYTGVHHGGGGGGGDMTTVLRRFYEKVVRGAGGLEDGRVGRQAIIRALNGVEADEVRRQESISYL